MTSTLKEFQNMQVYNFKKITMIVYNTNLYAFNYASNYQDRLGRV